VGSSPKSWNGRRFLSAFIDMAGVLRCFVRSNFSLTCPGWVSPNLSSVSVGNSSGCNGVSVVSLETAIFFFGETGEKSAKDGEPRMARISWIFTNPTPRAGWQTRLLFHHRGARHRVKMSKIRRSFGQMPHKHGSPVGDFLWGDDLPRCGGSSAHSPQKDTCFESVRQRKKMQPKTFKIDVRH
jgi:hypothetical protein